MNKIPYKPQRMPSCFSGTWANVSNRNIAIAGVLAKASNEAPAFYGCVLTFIGDSSVDVQVGGDGRIAGVLINPAGQNPLDLYRVHEQFNLDSQGALCAYQGSVVSIARYGEVNVWVHSGEHTLGKKVVYDVKTGELQTNVEGAGFITLPTAEFIEIKEKDINGDGEIDIAVLSLDGLKQH